jgi:hypothetical protein
MAFNVDHRNDYRIEDNSCHINKFPHGSRSVCRNHSKFRAFQELLLETIKHHVIVVKN